MNKEQFLKTNILPIIKSVSYIIIGITGIIFLFFALGSSKSLVNYLIFIMFIAFIAATIINVIRLFIALKNLQKISAGEAFTTDDFVKENKLKKIFKNIFQVTFYLFIFSILTIAFINSIKTWNDGGNQMFIFCIFMTIGFIFLIIASNKRRNK